MRRNVAIAVLLVVWGVGVTPAHAQSPDSLVRALVRRSMDALLAEDLNHRERAIQTLSCLGSSSRIAIPHLAHVAKEDPIGEIRFAALRALGRMGPDARVALPVIRAALNDEDHLVRVHAADALATLEPGASDVAVVTLANALRYSMREPGEVPSFFVFAALKRLGPRGRGAEPALMEMVREGELLDRLAAIRVLEIVGSNSEELVTLLVGALKDRTPLRYLRVLNSGAAIFLSPLAGGQFPDDRNTLRLLRYELRDVMEYGRLTREQCAGFLGRLGPKALPAVPALREALADSCPQVRKAARQALQQIEARP